MNNLQTRRDFLKTSGKVFAGVALATTLSPVMNVLAEAKPEAPEYPFPYAKLDPDVVEARAYKAFYDVGGCCRAVADGIIGQLADNVGYPFNQIPIGMFANGAGGYGAGTLCGSLNGAVAAIGLVCTPEDSAKLTRELFSWYKETPFPLYQPEIKTDKTTVSGSVNCEESVLPFMQATGLSMGDDGRKARCAGVSADVAKKTVELLNAHFSV